MSYPSKAPLLEGIFPGANAQKLFEENHALRQRLATLTHLDLEGAHRDLKGFVEMARKYLSPEHHEAAVYLLRLAYMRGRLDESTRTTPPIVLRACPICMGNVDR